MTYNSRTVNSLNPLARYAHRKRFKVAKEAIFRYNCGGQLLDYGCGDGRLLVDLSIAGYTNECVGFEPYMPSIEDAMNQTILNKWEDVVKLKPAGFELVTCFEVLEHFSPNEQVLHVDRMLSILSEGGYLIISVPIEKGLPALIKNMRRLFMHGFSDTLNLKNILHSMLGIKSQQILRIRNTSGYLNHMGFYFDELEEILLDRCSIIEVFNSPFKYVGYNLNSQRFYVLAK